MEIMENVGFTHFWGFSPALNLIENKDKKKETLNILLSGTSDLRHILKTIADNVKDLHQIKNINFYIHEKQKEPVARSLLLLQVLHESQLSYKERFDLFTDIFGNALIREKTQRYIDCFIPQMLNFLTDNKKTITPLKHLVDFKNIKYKQRDDLVDIVKTWHSSVPFTMEKHRDQRLRYLFKTRYDFKKNLIDWDYNMDIKEAANIIHFYHYKEWRLTGVAYESGFATYIVPNRTMASYIPGRTKSDRSSCMVRGYWGDVVVSPYIAMGVECEYEPLLFKVANKQNCGHSVEVTTFNFNYFLQMIDQKTEYIMVFTDMYRKKENRRKQDRGEEDQQQQQQQNEEEKKQENDDNKQSLGKKSEYREEVVPMIKEEENEGDEDEEENQKKKKNQENNTQNKQDGEQEEQKTNENQEIKQKKEDDQEINKISDKAQQKEQELQEQQQSQTDDSFMNNDESDNMSENSDSTQVSQASSVNSITLQAQHREGDLYEEKEQQILQGFKDVNMKIVPIFDELKTLQTKKKFQNLFDIGCVGFIMNGQFNNPEFKNLFKEDATIYAERNKYLVTMKKEEKKNLEGQLIDLAKQSGFELSDCPVDHHFKFTIQKQK